MNSVARRLSIVLVSLSLLPYAARGERVVLVAGGDQPVGTLPATQSKLRGPFGVDFDSTGRMFIVEISGHRVL
jgi:hypothetical protein